MYKIHLFETKAAHDAEYVQGSPDYVEPWVAYTREDEDVTYNFPKVDWSKEYLTFYVTESGTFKFSRACRYSINGGDEWISLAANTNTPTINAGEKILFKNTSTPTSTGGCGTFSSTTAFYAMGNPLSMISGDNFSGATTLPSNAFRRMFIGCKTLLSARNLSISSDTASSGCCYAMFSGCTSLKVAPELPATTLSGECYGAMFQGCYDLREAPKLPATTLAYMCYGSMFAGCRFERVPELPATTLGNYCYFSMFYGASIKKAPAVLPATALTNGCYNQMFFGCTSLTTAPELPATTLVNSCYQSMFSGCTSLSYIKMMATDISATNCLNKFTYFVAPSGTFVKNSQATWTTSGIIPSNWTVIDENGNPWVAPT